MHKKYQTGNASIIIEVLLGAMAIWGAALLHPKRVDRAINDVLNIKEISLDCGHCIEQELPEKTNQAILEWLYMQSKMK